MNWLNLNIPETLRSNEYIGSSPAERGTWLSVHAHAATIECGGVLVGAALWKDRQWQQTAGVTLREVRAASKLLTIRGDDVIVFAYNAAKEDQVKRARDAGSQGAANRWGSSEKKPPATPPAIAPAIETPLPAANAERKGRGMEGNGIQTAPASADAVGEPADSSPPPAQKAEPKPRERNPLFDALALAEGNQLDAITKPAAGAIATALSQIRKVSPDVTPAEIQRRADNYRASMPGATLTATALAKHWGRMDSPPLQFRVGGGSGRPELGGAMAR